MINRKLLVRQPPKDDLWYKDVTRALNSNIPLYSTSSSTNGPNASALTPYGQGHFLVDVGSNGTVMWVNPSGTSTGWKELLYTAPAASRITYGQLPTGGGTWANGGDLAFTGGSISIPFGKYLRGNNTSSTTDYPLIGVDSSNRVYIDAGTRGTAFGDQVMGIGGARGAPSFSFISDGDTGYWNPGPNQLEFTCGNSLAMNLNQTQAQFGRDQALLTGFAQGTSALSGSIVLPNNKYLCSDNTQLNASRRLVGFNTSNVVSVDPDAFGVLFGGTIAIGNTVNVVSPTSPNRTITMMISGTTYYLAAKTTND